MAASAGKTALFAWEIGEGLGHIPVLKAIATALKAIDYKSWIIPETSRPTKNALADAKKNVGTIRKLGL